MIDKKNKVILAVLLFEVILGLMVFRADLDLRGSNRLLEEKIESLGIFDEKMDLNLSQVKDQIVEKYPNLDIVYFLDSGGKEAIKVKGEGEEIVSLYSDLKATGLDSESDFVFEKEDSGYYLTLMTTF